jgi:hypothetical protein
VKKSEVFAPFLIDDGMTVITGIIAFIELV